MSPEKVKPTTSDLDQDGNDSRERTHPILAPFSNLFKLAIALGGFPIRHNQMSQC